jgi:amino acid permease
MTLAAVRDIAIIALAIESLVIGVLLIVLLWQLRGLTILVQEQIKPMLDSMQETIGTVKGTTSLVSETIVSPAIRISGFAAGLRRALQVMLKAKPPSSEE